MSDSRLPSTPGSVLRARLRSGIRGTRRTGSLSGSTPGDQLDAPNVRPGLDHVSHERLEQQAAESPPLRLGSDGDRQSCQDLREAMQPTRVRMDFSHNPATLSLGHQTQPVRSRPGKEFVHPALVHLVGEASEPTRDRGHTAVQDQNRRKVVERGPPDLQQGHRFRQADSVMLP